jgi:hypothetical protein
LSPDADLSLSNILIASIKNKVYCKIDDENGQKVMTLTHVRTFGLEKLETILGSSSFFLYIQNNSANKIFKK